MADRSRRRDTPTSVTRADFVRDPAAVMRMAETAGRPIVITDARGRATAIVSAPRDEREPQK
jgi:hypothetical protein